MPQSHLFVVGTNDMSSYREPGREYKETEVDIEVDRRRVEERPYETQIDITERDYRRRTDPTYDIGYEREYPRQDIRVHKEEIITDETKHKRDMGYTDDDGRYHSFRRGVERAADRVFHPFHHHDHHHREEIIIKDEGGGPARVREGVRETVRYVEPRGGSPADTISIPCHFIRVGDLVILQGRPCQVIRISTSPQTGQHRYLGIDLFTRQLHEESAFVTNPSPSVVVQSMLGPVFKQYRILDINDDGRLTAMTETGDVRSGLPVIEQGGLYGKISDAFAEGRGSVRALVINDGGRELVVDYRIVHGSRL